VKEAVHDWLRNQPQNFFYMALRSLQTAGLNVLRTKEMMLKSNVSVMSLTRKKFSFFLNEVRKLFEVPSYFER
jgi:hypothetical protein